MYDFRYAGDTADWAVSEQLLPCSATAVENYVGEEKPW